MFICCPTFFLCEPFPILIVKFQVNNFIDYTASVTFLTNSPPSHMTPPTILVIGPGSTIIEVLRSVIVVFFLPT